MLGIDMTSSQPVAGSHAVPMVEVNPHPEGPDTTRADIAVAVYRLNNKEANYPTTGEEDRLMAREAAALLGLLQLPFGRDVNAAMTLLDIHAGRNVGGSDFSKLNLMLAQQNVDKMVQEIRGDMWREETVEHRLPRPLVVPRPLAQTRTGEVQIGSDFKHHSHLTYDEAYIHVCEKKGLLECMLMDTLRRLRRDPADAVEQRKWERLDGKGWACFSTDASGGVHFDPMAGDAIAGLLAPHRKDSSKKEKHFRDRRVAAEKFIESGEYTLVVKPKKKRKAPAPKRPRRGRAAPASTRKRPKRTAKVEATEARRGGRC